MSHTQRYGGKQQGPLNECRKHLKTHYPGMTNALLDAVPEKPSSTCAGDCERPPLLAYRNTECFPDLQTRVTSIPTASEMSASAALQVRETDRDHANCSFTAQACSQLTTLARGPHLAATKKTRANLPAQRPCRWQMSTQNSSQHQQTSQKLKTTTVRMTKINNGNSEFRPGQRA